MANANTSSVAISKRTLICYYTLMGYRNVRTIVYQDIIIPFLKAIAASDDIIAMPTDLPSNVRTRTHIIMGDAAFNGAICVDSVIDAPCRLGESFAIPLDMKYAQVESAQDALHSRIFDKIVREVLYYTDILFEKYNRKFPYDVDSTGLLSSAFIFTASSTPCLFVSVEAVEKILGKDLAEMYASYIQALSYLTTVHGLAYTSNFCSVYSFKQLYTSFFAVDTTSHAEAEQIIDTNMFNRDIKAFRESDERTFSIQPNARVLNKAFTIQYLTRLAADHVTRTCAESIALSRVASRDIKQLLLEMPYVQERMAYGFIPRALLPFLLLNDARHFIYSDLTRFAPVLSGVLQVHHASCGLFRDGTGAFTRHALPLRIMKMSYRDGACLPFNYMRQASTGACTAMREALAFYDHASEKIKAATVHALPSYHTSSFGNLNDRDTLQRLHEHLLDNTDGTAPSRNGIAVRTVGDAKESLLATGLIETGEYDANIRMVEKLRYVRVSNEIW